MNYVSIVHCTISQAYKSNESQHNELQCDNFLDLTNFPKCPRNCQQELIQNIPLHYEYICQKPVHNKFSVTATESIIYL